MHNEIIKTLEAAGWPARLVGGCVRDQLLGRTPKDFDIVTLANPDQICEALTQGIFDKSTLIRVGESFGVIKVAWGGQVVDVATARSDGEYTDGRRPDNIQFASFKEDMSRRDFTINALSIGKDDFIFDYFRGQEDLEKKVIRTIGEPSERFNEDYLRMLRAVRFAVQLDFRIDTIVIDAIQHMAQNITKISAERVSDEFRKIMLSGNAVRGLELLKSTGLLQHIIPEFVETWGPKGYQDPKHHPEGNVWTHTRQVVSHAEKTGDFVLIMGAMLHDIGKPGTQEIREGDCNCDASISSCAHPERITNLGHDKLGAEMSRVICERLRLTAKETDSICDLVRLHMLMHNVDKLRKSRLIAILSRDDIDQLMQLQHADSLGSFFYHGIEELHNYPLSEVGERISTKSRKEFITSKIQELKPVWEVPAILSGGDLIKAGYKPGPMFKTILSKVRNAQLEGQLQNKDQALELVKLMRLTTGKI